MFESFKKKPADEAVDDRPTDPSRRDLLTKVMAGAGAATIGGVLVASKIEDNQEGLPTNPSLDYPTKSSGVVQKFESTRPIIMERLVHVLKTEGREIYILAIEFSAGLRKEKIALLERQVKIMDELKKVGNSNPKQTFLLLENDRINESLIGLNTYIKEIGTAMEQSPFHNAPATVHIEEKPESNGYIDENNLPTTPKERKRIM